MRTQKAIRNVSVNMVTTIMAYIPSFVNRKVFLNVLGNEYLGINSLYTNIIGLLSIVELGIGSAIIYSLYKPFANNDRVKIKGYLNFYKKFYRRIGFIILILGITMVPILNVFVKNQINLLEAQISFILYLINTFITYMFSYKLCILNVSQDEYKITLGTSISKFLIYIIQCIMLKLYPSFYIYLIIQIIINLTYFIYMNKYIDSKYDWLKSTKGKIDNDEKESLGKNIKALFVHKIGGIVVFGVDNLVLSYFLDLVVVGIYNSYNMVISALHTVISSALRSLTASIGNLLVKESSEDAYLVHKRIFFVSFWIISFITISLYNTIDQFISLWIGKEQVLDPLTINVILMNFYFRLMRSSVERFVEGGGRYYEDRFAPIFESIINLSLSIILVKKIGLAGVFIGTLASNLLVVFWVKPKIVYKYIFKKSLVEYFKMYFKYLFIGFIVLIFVANICNNIKSIISIEAFVLNCIINIILVNLIYLIIFSKNEDFKYFKNLVNVQIINKFKLVNKVKV